MMAKNRKLGKISITIFLTILIWVWADLSQDEELPLPNLVRVAVARSGDETLWVSFERPDGSMQSSVVLDNVTLKGPASQVGIVERMRNKGQLDLNLFLVPENEGLTEPGSPRSFNVLDFLKRNSEIQKLGLTVETCEPRMVTVQVRQLAAKALPVQCVDENGVVLNAKIEPPEVQAYVPEGVLVATVRLPSNEHNRARASVVKKTPYVQLAPGQSRDVATEVEVTLAREQMNLDEHRVTAKWAYCFSPVLQGKFSVELDPRSRQDLANIVVKATPEALVAYENETFHILLYVLDSDRQTMQVTDREVVFNFPEEFVRRNEIEAAVHPKASFTLVPIGTEDATIPPP